MRLPLSATLALLALPAAGLDLAELQQRGTLKVLAVVIEEEPAFLSLKPGTPPGFDHEILEGFAKLQRFKVEIVPVQGYDALIPALLKGKGDVIAGGFTATDVRRKQVNFTEEVFPTRNVIYTRKPGKVIKAVGELKGEKVGTYKGTSMAEDLAAAGVTNVDDGIELGAFPAALKSGRITAAVDGVEAALVARLKDPDLQIGAFIGEADSLAYAVRKEDAKLFEALNGYVANLRKTQTWSRLVVKYFGDAAPEILKKAREAR
ncbi:MAG TPA: ABC transporter substrate-binding protein [Vicinamibacteria bacterium]|nr:ABC transporter substrate-binding protein [Vicinamibacteria bacterium]